MSEVKNKKQCASEAWLNLLVNVFAKGRATSPRSQGCVERLCHTTVVDMLRPVVSVNTRKLSYRFMVAEAHWILSGSNSVSDISQYNKKIAEFSDDGERFDGAYGPRIVEQLRFVVEKLEQDPDTRQAVIGIWKQNPRESRDIPCTLSFQFLIREGELECVATMRSSDSWLGWPYDVFNFSCLSAHILVALRKRNPLSQFSTVGLGRLFLTAGSQHIYDRDQKRIEEVLEKPDFFDYAVSRMANFAEPSKLMSHLKVLRDTAIIDDVEYVSQVLNTSKAGNL